MDLRERKESLPLQRTAGSPKRILNGSGYHQSILVLIILFDYLHLHRLRQAQILLLDQDLAISEVAEMVGFKTHSYFGTVTRRSFGVTPTELRTKSLANLGLPEID